MSQPYSHVATTLQTVVSSKIKSATRFLSPTDCVKVTRQTPKQRGAHSETFLVTLGKPNFLGRRFVKSHVKAGGKFPVTKA